MNLPNGSVNREKVVQLIDLRKWKEASAEAERWISSEPSNAEAYATLAQINLKQNQFEQAHNWTNQALRYDPENVLAWYVRVFAYYCESKEQEFFEAVTVALRIDPSQSLYYFLRFNIYHKKGNRMEAEAEMLKALEINPDAPLYLAAYSYLQASQGELVQSRISERQALRIHSSDSQVFIYLAWAAELRAEDEKETEYFKNAVRLNPQNNQIREEYLKSLQKNDRFYRMLLMPSSLKNIKPTYFIISWFLAWIFFKPLVFVFIALYVLAHWTSKLLVQVKVFGWRNIFKSSS
ncbi:tetratricopeptide repeat protein [Paenibacillus psychroresistens]|uniref:tetratricopeptide repeat protein n=1 Tax=Paenibacillus psychroresistens TaxID=1778678 RepID=UPI001390ACC8|nr:tetratricopeptide repeat protein [Paenibacillus psychroresistens]